MRLRPVLRHLGLRICAHLPQLRSATPIDDRDGQTKRQYTLFASPLHPRHRPNHRVRRRPRDHRQRAGADRDPESVVGDDTVLTRSDAACRTNRPELHLRLWLLSVTHPNAITAHSGGDPFALPGETEFEVGRAAVVIINYWVYNVADDTACLSDLTFHTPHPSVVAPTILPWMRHCIEWLSGAHVSPVNVHR